MILEFDRILSRDPSGNPADSSHDEWAFNDVARRWGGEGRSLRIFNLGTDLVDAPGDQWGALTWGSCNL